MCVKSYQMDTDSTQVREGGRGDVKRGGREGWNGMGRGRSEKIYQYTLTL